jgi:hypothetical protein
LVRIIACIEHLAVIENILNHPKEKEANQISPIVPLMQPRAPPLLPMWELGLADWPEKQQTSGYDG